MKTLKVLLATTIWSTTKYYYITEVIRPNKTEMKIIAEKN